MLGSSLALAWSVLASVRAVFMLKVSITLDLEKVMSKAIAKIVATEAALLGRRDRSQETTAPMLEAN